MAIVDYENLPSENTPLTGGSTGNLNVMQENGTTYGTDTKLGYAQSFLNDHIVNVSNEVDEDYRVNVLHSKNIFDNNSKQTFDYNTSLSKISTGIQAKVSISDTNCFACIDIGALKDFVGKKIYVKFTSQSSTNKGRIYLGKSPEGQTSNREVLADTGEINNGSYAIQTNTITDDSNKPRLFIAIYSNGSSNNSANVDTYVNYTNIMVSTEDIPYEPYITPSIYVDNEEIYSKDNLNIDDITNEITFTTGFQIDDGKLYKQGKHIFGTLNIKTPTLTAGTQYSSFMNIHHTLKTTTITGGFATTGDRWGTNSGFCYLYIATSGACAVSSNINATYLRIIIDIMEA